MEKFTDGYAVVFMNVASFEMRRKECTSVSIESLYIYAGGGESAPFYEGTHLCRSEGASEQHTQGK